MLAMARALCLEPQVLLLDEPTEGLMPSMIAKIRETVAKLRELRRLDHPGRAARRCGAAGRRPRLFIENGRNRETVDVEELRADLGGQALCRRRLMSRKTENPQSRRSGSARSPDHSM